MAKLIGLSMLLLGVAGQMFAGTNAPEVDPASAVAAITLLGGGIMVLRARRAK